AENPLLTQASVDFMWSQQLDGANDLHGWVATYVKDENENDVLAFYHDGIWIGASSLIFRREDGISFVLLFNRNVSTYLGGGPLEEGGQLSDLANQVAVWPSGDLFPEYGIPAFRGPRRKTLASFVGDAAGMRVAHPTILLRARTAGLALCVATLLGGCG